MTVLAAWVLVGLVVANAVMFLIEARALRKAMVLLKEAEENLDAIRDGFIKARTLYEEASLRFTQR